jgi:hypothetical protein
LLCASSTLGTGSFLFTLLMDYTLLSLTNWKLLENCLTSAPHFPTIPEISWLY